MKSVVKSVFTLTFDAVSRNNENVSDLTKHQRYYGIIIPMAKKFTGCYHGLRLGVSLGNKTHNKDP